MPQIGIRITHELHGHIIDVAEEQSISISDFVRHAVEHVLNGCETPSTNAKHGQHLEQQIHEKDEQIRELHQLLGVAQKNVGELSEQFTKQLEDHRHSRSWWRFWGK